MNELGNRVKSLLDNQEIDLFIGYEQGTSRPRPSFVRNAEDAENLIFDANCSGNLAVYLTRKDLVKGKKIGVSASYFALRSISQLFKENQLKKDLLRIFSLDSDSKLIEFESVDAINDYLLKTLPPTPIKDDVLLEQLNAMDRQQRWSFWAEELSKCFKCYACRAACPMCYCSKCVVEENRPQWIQPWASPLSNMEWQINRVMHLTGRCSDCGSCGAACPVGIPLHLLTHHVLGIVESEFGGGQQKGNVLSTYKPEDKEAFIH